MSDPRIRNLARTLVRYCIDARQEQTVGVEATPAAAPLVDAVHEEILRCGAFPAWHIVPDGAAETIYRVCKPDYLKSVSPYERAYSRCVNSTIGIHAETNTRALTGVQPGKQVEYARTMKPIWTVLRRKPWVLTVFPTLAYAQDAEMSLGEYEDFVYGATFSDEANPVAAWRALGRRQQKLIRRLEGAREIRLLGPDTDLTLHVEGRAFINSDGHKNMPSGEVFTSPVETSAEGFIRYDFPVCRGGREVSGIRLVFRRGVVVEASAEKNEAYLKSMLATDQGASRLGELGIGTNFMIRRFTRHILFDEKIGGTVHLAVGRGYAEAGGKNQSAIHWDMIKDLRRGGAIYVDGKLFQKDGRFAV